MFGPGRLATVLVRSSSIYKCYLLTDISNNETPELVDRQRLGWYMILMYLFSLIGLI